MPSAILAQLQRWLPVTARVLEIASGTGQHAQHMAAAQPLWDWQPSEPRSEAMAGIARRCAALPNVRPPLLLDVEAGHWPVDVASFDAVFVANLLHIAPWSATPALLQGAARGLKPRGVLVVYGPFVVEGQALAASNAAFDADLRMRNPLWGLRQLQQVRAAALEARLALVDCCDMPANNLMLRFAQLEHGPAAT